MLPSLLLAVVPVVASTLGLPAVQAPSPPDLGSAIQSLTRQFAAEATVVLTTVDGSVMDIARAAYVTCLLVGTLLYFTHLSKRLGKDLIYGGVALVLLTEYLVPAVTALT